jgi:hypothetical protein
LYAAGFVRSKALAAFQKNIPGACAGATFIMPINAVALNIINGADEIPVAVEIPTTSS